LRLAGSHYQNNNGNPETGYNISVHIVSLCYNTKPDNKSMPPYSAHATITGLIAT
jgi:hypothetical protein